MDATQGTSLEFLDELDTWLHCCDICVEVATSPVATTCGHFFCRSCLNEAFQGQQARPCPVCRVDLLEETAQSFPINRIETPAEPTPEVANSEIPINRIETPAEPTPAEPTPEAANSEIPTPNVGNRGPAARTPMTARSSLISTARMDVVHDYLEEESERIHNIQLTLSRRVSDLRGERILQLEQVVDNLMQMNLAVIRDLEDCDNDRRRMSRRIEELENSTEHGTSVFARRQQRVGRRITPTPIAARNEEAAPGSVEGRLFTTN